MKSIKDLATKLAKNDPYQDFSKPHPVRDTKKAISKMIASHKRTLKGY